MYGVHRENYVASGGDDWWSRHLSMKLVQGKEFLEERKVHEHEESSWKKEKCTSNHRGALQRLGAAESYASG